MRNLLWKNHVAVNTEEMLFLGHCPSQCQQAQICDLDLIGRDSAKITKKEDITTSPNNVNMKFHN